MAEGTASTAGHPDGWLASCESPRPRPAGIDWDVFISYRSLDRRWTIALADVLSQIGYQVFLDQFVLVPGQGLTSQLGRHLERSAAGILIWSSCTRDSEWVAAEIDAMHARQRNSAGGGFPFHYVVASLDGEKPPGLLAGQLYLDFSAYPDGPAGADLVRLTCGLQGRPLNPEAVRLAVEFDTATREEPNELRALAAAGLHGRILEKVRGDDPAYTTAARLPALAVDLLIAARQYGPGEEGGMAGEALAVARLRFPRSVRLQQLEGLLLRRTGRLREANFLLSRVLEQSQRDTETLGMLAAVRADVWERRLEEGDAEGARDALEKSRTLYAEGFAKVPTDTYTGINAAAKSALLGEGEQARQLAAAVLARLQERSGEPGAAAVPDYWTQVTEAEARLLLGEAERARELYHRARIDHVEAQGSIGSTATQLRRLLAVLPLEEAQRRELSREFRLETEPA